MAVGRVNSGGGGIGSIKSIQRGSTTLAAANLSIDINLTAVDIDNAIVKITYSGLQGATSLNVGVNMIGAKIIDSTTLRLTRKLNGMGMTIAWEVVEYKSVKSLQSGEVDARLRENQVAVNEVNEAKTQLFFSATSSFDSTANGVTQLNIKGELLNATTLEFVNLNTMAAGVRTIYWYLVEFE